MYFLFNKLDDAFNILISDLRLGTRVYLKLLVKFKHEQTLL